MKNIKKLVYNDACIELSKVFGMNATWDGVRVNEKHDLVHTIIVKDKHSDRQVMIELDLKLCRWSLVAEMNDSVFTEFKAEEPEWIFDVDASLAANIDNIEFTNTKESKEVLNNLVIIFEDNEGIVEKLKERLSKMNPMVKHNLKETQDMLELLYA